MNLMGMHRASSFSGNTIMRAIGALIFFVTHARVVTCVKFVTSVKLNPEVDLKG